MIQPLLSVMIESDQNDNLVMDLLVENVGAGIAYDVKFEAIPDFQIIEGQLLSQIGLFKTGLPYFAPHQKIKLYLTWMPSNYEKKVKSPFKIRISYKNSLKRNYKQEFLVDLALFGLVPLPKNPLIKISETLEKMERKLHDMNSDIDPVKVVAYKEEEISKKIEHLKCEGSTPSDDLLK